MGRVKKPQPYFRDAKGRFASPARFEWAQRATGAYTPVLTLTDSKPDIPTLTDVVKPRMGWLERALTWFTWNRSRA